MTNEWDQVAEEYSQKIIGEQGDFNRQSMISPEIMRAAKSLSAGAKVLDLGCGEGYVGRLLADMNFQLTGVDYSQKLLDIAKSRNTPGKFIKADLNEPTDIGDDFDLVISNMVFMDVANLQHAYQNAYRSLKPNGVLLVFILHPALSRYTGKWVKTWTDKILRRDPFVRIDNYLEEGPRRIKMCSCKHATTIWHRPLMKYIEIPLSLGFKLVEFKELAPSMEDVKRSSKPRFLTKIPEFVMLRFIKNG